MLNGIDISSWNGDINIAVLQDCDFVIVKATEGLTYVNPYYSKADETLAANKLLGVYHYGRMNNASAEADHFIKHYKKFKYRAIPVLDWEENQSVAWVNEFVRHFHEETGVWCWIYANPWRFNQGGVEKNCSRWIAAYPNDKVAYFSTDPGNVPPTDGEVCAWQYSSNGRVSPYEGRLDINHYYGDKASWFRYANPNAITDIPSTPETSTSSVLENDEYKVTVERK